MKPTHQANAGAPMLTHEAHANPRPGTP